MLDQQTGQAGWINIGIVGLFVGKKYIQIRFPTRLEHIKTKHAMAVVMSSTIFNVFTILKKEWKINMFRIIAKVTILLKVKSKTKHKYGSTWYMLMYM